MKLYDRYLMLKKKDDSKKYLFKSGNFYIFLDDDAKEVNKVTTLKLTSFGNGVKCGFPINSLDKYLTIFENIGMDVVVVENIQDIIGEVNSMNLDKLSNGQLISIIERFKCLQ